MAEQKLSKLEYGIMEALWAKEEASIRELQESFPEKRRPAYIRPYKPRCTGWRAKVQSDG